jgi:hypothetical protein
MGPEALRFRRALRRPAQTQEALLTRLVRGLAGSAYGRAHNLSQVRRRADLRHLPVVDYDALRPWIERAAAGETQVLTVAPLRCFEPTSGSGGAAKLIPYTDALLADFHRATAPWLFDLATAWPALARTRSYWAISPGGARGQTTSGGVPLGLPDDTAYLGAITRLATRHLLAVPGEVSATADMAACRDATAHHLLAADDLGFISVWSPTFLTLLFEHIDAHWDRLLTTLSPARRATLGRLDGFAPTRVWPQLALVSCWTQAASARFLPALRRWVPGVPLQGKGLLSTEGVFSIPLAGREGAVAAITSHVLELAPTDGGPPVFIEQAEIGAEYVPLLTTSGGLIRYRTGDRVRCVGLEARTPLFVFLGRADGGSDLCGEKLTVPIVEQALRAVGGDALEFALLAPTAGEPPGYVLYAEGPAPTAQALDAALRRAHHYDRCRALGQLACVQVRPVNRGAARFEAGCVARGMRAGDIKPTALHPAADWAGWLT